MLKVYRDQAVLSKIPQWELECYVGDTFNLKLGDKVRFTSASGETWIMGTYMLDGFARANIPNEILQRAGYIVAEIIGKPACTTRIQVYASAKPDDYKYVEADTYLNANKHLVTDVNGRVAWDDNADIPVCNYGHKQLVTDFHGSSVWENKSHYDDRHTITWDGETEGLLEDDLGRDYYKVSNLIPSREYFEDGLFEWTAAGRNAESTEFSGLTAFDFGYSLTFNNSMSIYVVHTAPARQSMLSFSEPGIWFSKSSRGAYCTSLTWGELKQFDEKYLPSTVPVIQTATVGQTIAVKAVDENGKPTEWGAVDLFPLIFQMQDGANISPEVIDSYNLEMAMLSGAGVVLIDGTTGETMQCISHSTPGNGNKYCVFYSALLKDHYYIAIESDTGGVTVNRGLPDLGLA